MITFSGKLVNNTKSILNRYKLDKENFLQDVKSIGLSNVKAETPVLSGKLKEGNRADVNKDFVGFYNIVDYFIFVHFGTIYQSANPFMFRGLTKAKAEFVVSLLNNLSVK